MNDLHHRILSPGYLDGLDQLPIDEVRRMRAECVEVETGLSYLRRMVQGPLDLVNRELVRRANGEAPADLATVVAELPETLGDAPRPPGLGRLTQALEPVNVDPELEAELDVLVSETPLTGLGGLSDAELTALAERLRTYESDVSERRRAFFDVIDRLQGELARRYRDGEASVDTLLDDA